MERIRRLEAGPRGLYCGAFGWIAPGGDFSFCVPIRTALVDADGNLRLDVGSGIVADSEPASEYAECLAKARFLTGLAPDFALFETLRFEDGGFPLLARHLARLARSAEALGFRCDVDAARDALLAHVGTLEGSRRVRLQLEADGRLSITDAELAPLAGEATVCLAAGVLASANPLLHHKTTARAHYDEALRQAMALGHFDALFFNERDELCEGARSNVFVKIGGRMCTPPLASGLLPGVMRETLLASGAAEERVIDRAELLAAEEIFVANALRGLVRVRLSPETVGV
jgi:para-aminobenzoate synthetase/4-amino-4-deoxychorismate lyase